MAYFTPRSVSMGVLSICGSKRSPFFDFGLETTLELSASTSGFVIHPPTERGTYSPSLKRAGTNFWKSCSLSKSHFSSHLVLIFVLAMGSRVKFSGKAQVS